MSVREVLESALAAAEIAVLLPISPLARRFFNRAGATDPEVSQNHPTDAYVPHPQQSYVRAISIGAPPEIVWGYLTQLGQERAGMYSYDALENLVGCQMHTVDHRVPEWKEVRVGDVVRFGPAEKGYPTQKIIEVQPLRLIVWQGVDARTLQPMGGISAIISYHLEQTTHQGTRLIVRSRLAHPPTLGMRLLWRVTEVLNFVMEQKMLRSIKAYAERDARGVRRAAAPA